MYIWWHCQPTCGYRTPKNVTGWLKHCSFCIFDPVCIFLISWQKAVFVIMKFKEARDKKHGSKRHCKWNVYYTDQQNQTFFVLFFQLKISWVFPCNTIFACQPTQTWVTVKKHKSTLEQNKPGMLSSRTWSSSWTSLSTFWAFIRRRGIVDSRTKEIADIEHHRH